MTLLPYPFGLSPWPVAPFGTTLVVIRFRGFPEFEGLATRRPSGTMSLDDYIIELAGEISPMDVLTLFSLPGGYITLGGSRLLPTAMECTVNYGTEHYLCCRRCTVELLARSAETSYTAAPSPDAPSWTSYEASADD